MEGGMQLDRGAHSIRLLHNLGHGAARLDAKTCVGFEQGSEDFLVLAQVSCQGLAGPMALGLCLLELHAIRENELEGIASAKTLRVAVRDAHGGA
jgi:hypothetical protein